MLEKKYKKVNDIVQFNTVISDAFPIYNFYPSILNQTQTNGVWDLSLPDISNVGGIVLHTQDNLNVACNDIVPEILLIEDFYDKKNINNIVLVHWNHGLNEIYDGGINLIEFPTHSFDFVQKFSNKFEKWRKVNEKINTINFMCLNGRPRKHRVLVYNYLKSLNIHSFISMSGDDTTSYDSYTFDNVENYINLIDLYRSAPVNIVTETLYYESKGILTEKLFQAFAGLQLPILIAHKGAVADARRYGFDMFDDVIDNSFDTCDNDIRWQKAIDDNLHILNNEFNYQELLPRLQRNQYYLLNEYCHTVVDGVNQQVSEMFSKIHENHQT